MAGVLGFESRHIAEIEINNSIRRNKIWLGYWDSNLGILPRSKSTTQSTIEEMAGVLGFEPRYGEIKTRCLTAWRHPNYGGYDGIRTCDPRIMSAML